MLSIIKATATDIPRIRQMAMDTWPQTYTPIIGPQQVSYMLDLFYSPEALLRQMEVMHHRFILCFSDGEAAGFASYGAGADGSFKLHKLYVLPGLQGKGIGGFMIDHIARELRSEGVKALTLNVNRYNASAISFYGKMGFRHHADEDIDIGEGYFMNDHVLELPL